ncbi:MAG: hydratase [Betaproteobacteria bacterium]|nr:hydratase [Betaproteobacteria bacterium]
MKAGDTSNGRLPGGAAETLACHRLAREPLDSLPEAERPRDEREAYAVQELVHARLERAGLGPVAGYKIGCTTPVMQAFLKIPNPCGGAVLAGTVYRSPAVIPHDAFVRVGVECEIVARLGQDLPARAEPYSQEEVEAAVATVMPGMEIVDARYVDYTRLDTPTLIADDFFDAGCVLGDERDARSGPDLAGVVGVTRINGEEVGRGRGADVMGHPFRALAWLANSRSARGLGLEAGRFVFLGSVVETKWLARGDLVEMDLAGLGRVEARFT